MTMTVKKTEKRQQKFFTNQVGSLKPQSRWIWSWSKKDYENVVIVFVLALIIIIRTAVHYLALSPLKIQIPISNDKLKTITRIARNKHQDSGALPGNITPKDPDHGHKSGQFPRGGQVSYVDQCTYNINYFVNVTSDKVFILQGYF